VNRRARPTAPQRSGSQAADRTSHNKNSSTPTAVAFSGLITKLFGLRVGQTFMSWSVMETAVSAVGFGCVMEMSLVV
jgi:hypothetical protein